MGLGVNHIDKLEFLPLYQQARAQALSESNIKSGFRATGLKPYKPDAILLLLPAQYQTPSPTLSAQQLPSSQIWIAKTPRDILELQKQTKHIKRCLQQHSQSPPTPTERALDQLVKGCEIAVHNAMILAGQNKLLLVKNQRQKQKRAQKRSYIARDGVLSGSEDQDQPIEEVPQPRRQRAPPRCSLYGSLLHNTNKCSVQQERI
jgi:hypothetical protein